MMPDLFSTFDPVMHKIHSRYSTTWWFTNSSYLLILMPTLFVGGSRYTASVRLYIGYLAHWLNSKHISHMMGVTLILASSITLILSTNMIGQLPYAFPLTVSPVFSMALCLPIWFGAIASSLAYAPSPFLAALIPLGTPLVLIPIVITAELVSNFEWSTRCARLIINMMFGQLYLKLAVFFSMLALSSTFGPALETLTTIFLMCLVIFFDLLIALL